MLLKQKASSHACWHGARKTGILLGCVGVVVCVVGGYPPPPIGVQFVHVQKHLRIIRRISDLTEADIQPEYATGKGFLHEHPDLYGRPVVIIRAARHRIGEFPPQSSQLTCAYVLEQAVRALPPGQENILGVFDLRGFGTQNADILFAKFLVWFGRCHVCYRVEY